MTFSNLTVKRVSINHSSESYIRLIESFLSQNDGLIFHDVKLNLLASQYSGSILSYLIAYNKGELVGVCPVHSYMNKLSLVSYSGLTNYEIPYGGWVFKVNMGDIDVSALLKTRYNEILTYTSHIESKGHFESIYRKETVVLQLTSETDDTLWDKINSKRKNMIRKAQKNEVRIDLPHEDSLRDFYSLILNMNERTSMRSKPYEFYRDVYALLKPNHIHVRTAYYFDKAIATVMLLSTNNTWHYWQGASDRDYNLGALDLLLWESIKYARDMGGKFFDFCVIDRTKLPNIAQHKLSYGGAVSEYYTSSLASLPAKVISKICRKLL